MILLFLSVALAAPADPAARTQTINGYDGEAKRLIDEVWARYRTVETYRDRMTVRFDVEAHGRRSLLPEGQVRVAFAFARPNRFTMDAGGLAVYCDGRRLWRHAEGLGQFIESTAPPRMAFSADALGGGDKLTHPIGWLLGQIDQPVEEALNGVTHLLAVRREERGERDGRTLRGRLTLRDLATKSRNVPWEAWVGDDTGLIGEIRLDLTLPVRELAEEMENLTVDRFVVVFTFDDVAVNPSVPDDQFVFQPRPDHKRVTAFEAKPSQESEPLQKASALGQDIDPEKPWISKTDQPGEFGLGQPMKDFTAADLDGRSVSFSEYRGRVVLLEIWQAHCKACEVGMQTTQQLAKDYEQAGLVVLGLNCDPTSKLDQVRQKVAKTGVRYRQILDPQQKVVDSFRWVLMIPTYVLIDKKGVIRDRFEGAPSPARLDTLIGEIEYLLQ